MEKGLIEYVGVDKATGDEMLNRFIVRGACAMFEKLYRVVACPRLKRVEVTRHGVSCVYFDAKSNRWFTSSWSI